MIRVGGLRRTTGGFSDTFSCGLINHSGPHPAPKQFLDDKPVEI